MYRKEAFLLEKAYKFRLCPTAKQEELIHKTIGCSRFVYNQTLVARKGAYASGNSIHMTFKESHRPVPKKNIQGTVGHTGTYPNA